MSKTAILLGAGGGIGRALLELLLDDSQVSRVFATHRLPTSSTREDLDWVQLDLSRQQQIDAALDAIRAQTDCVDLFLCASGFLHGAGAGPEKGLAALDSERLGYSYAVNASGPLCVFAGLVPLLRAADAPKALFLSAQVGSITDNGLGGWYGYRMAKAALNMGVKTAAIEAARWRNDATVVAVHPGTTRSELSRPFIARRRARVRSTVETAANLYGLMSRLDATQTGQFFTSEGGSLPW